MAGSHLRKGAEEARNQLPDLLDAAEKGRPTIITRHGHPVAALLPIEAYAAAVRQQSLLPAGSGRGLRGKSSTRTLRSRVTNGTVRPSEFGRGCSGSYRLDTHQLCS